MNDDQWLISVRRRDLLRLFGIGGGIAALPRDCRRWRRWRNRARKRWSIGIDTSDSTELDPVRDLHYTPPMTISACYDCAASRWRRATTST